MTRTAVLIAITVTLGASCSRLPEHQAAEGTSASSTPAPAADIVCTTDGGTEVLSNEIAASRDGVHVLVHNEAGEAVSISGLGVDVEQTTEEVVTRTPPGRVDVACWPFSNQGGEDPRTYPLTVTDPKHYWVDPELECPPGGISGGGINDYGSGAEGERGEPPDVASRRVDGLQRGDVVELAAYPEAAYPVVRVVRSGRTVGTMDFAPAESGGWLVLSWTACSDAHLHDNMGRPSDQQ